MKGVSSKLSSMGIKRTGRLRGTMVSLTECGFCVGIVRVVVCKRVDVFERRCLLTDNGQPWPSVIIYDG